MFLNLTLQILQNYTLDFSILLIALKIQVLLLTCKAKGIKIGSRTKKNITTKNYETDFYISKEDLLIQVSYDISDIET